MAGKRSGTGGCTARLQLPLQKPTALSLVGCPGWEKVWRGLRSSQSSSSHPGGREGNETDKQSRKTRWLKKQAAFFPLKFDSGQRSGAAPGRKTLLLCLSIPSHTQLHLHSPPPALRFLIPTSEAFGSAREVAAPHLPANCVWSSCKLMRFDESPAKGINHDHGYPPGAGAPSQEVSAGGDRSDRPQPVPKPAGGAVARGRSAASAGSPPLQGTAARSASFLLKL